jgi:1,4-dihydroxy-2-naphthoate octaprenyltransferase
MAMRPKTWIASISPVLLGASLAVYEGLFSSFFLFVMTLCFALFIQIGTNLSNDVHDHLKGADSFRDPASPVRVVEQGLLSPRAVALASWFFFVGACICGLPLIQHAGLWSSPLVFLSLFFGYFYTAGPFPIAYLGLGEIFVLPFFGILPTLGTYYLQTKTTPLSLVILGLIPGLLSSAILVANNLRDARSDALANKKTLIVRFGIRFGMWEYLILHLVAFMLIPFALPKSLPWPLQIAPCLALLTFPQTWKTVCTQSDAAALATLLPLSAKRLLLFSIVTSGVLLLIPVARNILHTTSGR